ncbi:alcohol dehydrogenase 1 isoform X3 [Cryptomeria japonica]|uniref:alcohol dehydrogenase 1 isoform X3 n=1 Tax=Cryptomeria japonica TaxID=3369 RepID=UPI0027DAAD87|nr:alcohol dehydrogenase 1 isoform X3 [Cryptomeria japonica]
MSKLSSLVSVSSTTNPNLKKSSPTKRDFKNKTTNPKRFPQLKSLPNVPPGAPSVSRTARQFPKSSLASMFKKNQGHVPIFPRIFGHEATRIIQSVGEGVIDRREDDCVLTFFTRECKECMHSKSDKRNMSETLRMVRKGVMHGDQKTHFSVNGKPISHFCAVSSFSEYAVVHSGYIVKLSSYVPFGKICVLGCGIATDNSPIGHDIQAVGRSPHKMIEAAMQSTAKGKIYWKASTSILMMLK